jgi:hypothetical protein
MRKINKDKLLKYGQYLKESLDPWKLKQGIKSFNRLPEDLLTIPGDLKDLSEKCDYEIIIEVEKDYDINYLVSTRNI